MNDDIPGSKPPEGRTRPAPENREARLRDALRANLLRRKAQARARAAHDKGDGDEGQEDA